jgi:hypothetical protein
MPEHLAKITKLRDEENQLLTDQPEVMVMQERKKSRCKHISWTEVPMMHLKKR